MADQAASLYGSGSFQPGDLKVTMGTGSFVNVNSGRDPHASITGNSFRKRFNINQSTNNLSQLFFSGLYPLVGWRIGSELVYIVEGASNDTGSLIEWAKFIGIIFID